MSEATDLSIIESFKEEAMEKGLDHVTMGNVADRCGCARQTIYYHFRGTADLLRWIVLNECSEYTYDTLERNKWKNEMFRLLNTLKKNESLVNEIYNSKHWGAFSEMITGIIHDKVIKTFFMTCSDYGSAKSRDNIARLLTYGFAGQTMDWIKEGLKDDPVELMKDYDRLCGASMYRLIEDFLVLRPREAPAGNCY